MGLSCFSRSFLLTVLLLLFSNGFGRKLADSPGNEEHALLGDSEQGKLRMAIELDYLQAGPNVNGRSGYFFASPPSLPPPAGPAPEFGY